MGVYDFNNLQDLQHDFNDIYNRINQIYAIDNEFNITPKLIDTSDTFWATEENSQEFNKHVPTFKSLHKDMYAFIETVSRIKYTKYNYADFESKYPDFREFRHLNNMIKHPKAKEVEISFSKIVYIEPKQFDLMCNFKYPDNFKCLMYSEFIIQFLTILTDLEIITIQK
jgi:hypothetical protein